MSLKWNINPFDNSITLNLIHVSQYTSKFATLSSLEGEMLTDLLPLSSTFLLNAFLISLMTAEE